MHPSEQLIELLASGNEQDLAEAAWMLGGDGDG